MQFIFLCHVQDAKKDESVRKSYKYLAALHEVCFSGFLISNNNSTYLSFLLDNVYMSCFCVLHFSIEL